MNRVRGGSAGPIMTDHDWCGIAVSKVGASMQARRVILNDGSGMRRSAKFTTTESARLGMILPTCRLENELRFSHEDIPRARGMKLATIGLP